MTFLRRRSVVQVQREGLFGALSANMRLGALSVRRVTVTTGWIIALWIAVRPCSAQEGLNVEPDPIDTEYSTGAELMSADALGRVPKKPTFRAYLPPSVDLSRHMPQPGQQGQIGSCASWAIGYAARSFYVNMYEGKPLSSANIPSPLALYHAARSEACPGGTTFEENADVLENKPLPSLKTSPYTDSCKVVQSVAGGDMHQFSINGYYTLSRVGSAEIKGQLAVNNPVVISMRTNSAFQKLRRHRVFSDRSFSFPTKDRHTWHAMAVVGYDDSLQAVRVMNSWGRGWGNGGYAWISYDIINDPQWTREAFVLDVSKPEPAPVTPVVMPEPVPAPAPKPVPAPVEDTAAFVEQIKKLKCSELNIVSEGEAYDVVGYVGMSADWDKIVDRSKHDHNINITHLSLSPWPACEVQETLALPSKKTEFAPKIVLSGNGAYTTGQAVEFSILAPNTFSYLYVFYIQADGSVISLAQPSGLIPRQTEPKRVVQFGDGKDGRQKFEVSAPFGSEFIIAITARSPLFDGTVPNAQTDREFLTSLRRALIYKPDPHMPDRVVAASFRAITTRE